MDLLDQWTFFARDLERSRNLSIGIGDLIEPNERVEADDGYEVEAPFKAKCPSSMTIAPERKVMMSRVGKRQETVNRRFKQWKILKSVFRHDLTMHCRVFSAIAVITQLAIENGEPLFQVDYDDNLDEE